MSFFQFEGDLYEQVDGVAKVRHLDLSWLTNSCMCNIKKQLETENNRYQDKLVQSTIR